METYKERNIKERNIKKWNNKENQVNKDNDENVSYGFSGEEVSSIVSLLIISIVVRSIGCVGR